MYDMIKSIVMSIVDRRIHTRVKWMRYSRAMQDIVKDIEELALEIESECEVGVK